MFAEFDKLKTNSISAIHLVSSINMDTFLRSIARWILAFLLISASLHQSDAIVWRKQPNKPTILVEGVNNSDVNLEWDFSLAAGEIVQSVIFQRKKPGSSVETTLASRLSNTAFTVFPQYLQEYGARLPCTLLLRDVNNDEEYIYSIVINYVRSMIVQIPFTDQNEVIVYALPRITREPVKKSEVNVGQDLTLTCKASGDPTPNVTWTKDGVPQNQFSVSGYMLHLVNVQRKDVGSYRCTARNGYGIATSLAMVTVLCPPNNCRVLEVGITITSVEWKQEFAYPNTVEHKMLKTNLSSVIARLYTLQQNAAKQLFELTILEFRRGSTIAVVRLKFQKDVLDPLKPLRDDVADGNLGPNLFGVAKLLDLNPHSSPSTAPTHDITSESQPTTQDPTTSSSEPALASFRRSTAAQVTRNEKQLGSTATRTSVKGAKIGIIAGGTIFFIIMRTVIS